MHFNLVREKALYQWIIIIIIFIINQYFRLTAPLRESRIAIRECPQINGERANLAL